jgi:hypothetical protein
VLLLGLEVLVADDALISKLGEPFELTHVFGLGRAAAGAAAATGCSWRPKSCLIPILLWTNERRRSMRAIVR